MNDTVVLLGGAGFIGRHLARRLTAEGVSAVILDRQRPAALPDVEIELGDFADPTALERVLRPGRVVVHLAWSTLPATSNEDPAADLRENVSGSLTLLDACCRAGVGRLLFFSSGGTVYGNARRVPLQEDDPTDPICAYGVSKLMVEKYLALFRRLSGLDFIILRPSTAYGPDQDYRRGQGAVTAFADLAARGEPIPIWGDGNVVRDFLHVGDLVDATVRLIGYDPGPAGPRVFNVGTGQATSLRELVTIIGRALGRQPVVQYAPPRGLDVAANVLDSTRLREATGWRPSVTLPEGILDMLRAWETDAALPAGRRGRV
jgi:UDP-glucose 4-epimerase